MRHAKREFRGIENRRKLSELFPDQLKILARVERALPGRHVVFGEPDDSQGGFPPLHHCGQREGKAVSVRQQSVIGERKVEPGEGEVISTMFTSAAGRPILAPP